MKSNVNIEERSSIIYVTKDRERAEGMPENELYSIISGDENEDTFNLLQKSGIPAGTSILVFKNTPQIEEIAAEKKLHLLNPSAVLAEKIENKVTQVKWLGDLARLLPPHEVVLVKNITRKPSDLPFILQWAHSHSGEGTLHITKDAELVDLIKKFPEREARITDYIKGPMFTANIVVSSDKILVGNISYQITGIPPFTDNPMTTIGNDWSVTDSLLTESQIEQFNSIAIEIGNKMKSEGWKGLFGIDVVHDIERDTLFLIEINARQPASTTYESQLQEKARTLGVPGITTFEAHLAALTDTPITSQLIEINDGAQIIQRVVKNKKSIPTIHLENLGYKVISYTNTKLNADLIRIQSSRGIMEAHNKFNSRGKEIETIVT